MTPKEQVHFRILRTIELNPEISERELARELGVSNGKVHYLIVALLQKGLIKIGNFQRGNGRLRKIAYLLTPEGIKDRTELTQNYLARKEAEYEALRAEIESLRKTSSDSFLRCPQTSDGDVP